MAAVSMIYNLALLIPALVLLWLPRRVYQFGKTLIKEPRTKSSSEGDPRTTRAPGDISVRFLEEIAKPRNYLEFLRAIAAGYLLVGTDAFGAAIHAAPGAPSSVARKILLIRAAILFIGVVIQTVRFDGRSRLFPPIFYLTGIAFALAGPQAAGFAVVLTWLVNRSIPSPIGFFLAFAGILGGFGFVFDGRSLTMILACVLMLVPSAISLLSSRPLIAMSRKTARESAD
jgi:hypothetical protein